VETLSKLAANYYYLVAIVVFIIGMHTMLTHANLIKKVIAMNMMDAAVFLLFVAIGYVRGGRAPVVQPGSAEVLYVNPLPGALILTGIVVAISVTAYALSLIIKIYRYYGTVDYDEIVRLRGSR
jgi:multicomponent Na+:H+ antiporter subunit C